MTKRRDLAQSSSLKVLRVRRARRKSRRRLDDNYLSLLLAHIFTRRNFNEHNRKPSFLIIVHRGQDENDTRTILIIKQSQITIISLHITCVYITESLSYNFIDNIKLYLFIGLGWLDRSWHIWL